MDIATDKQVEQVIQAVADEMISLSSEPKPEPRVVLSRVDPEQLPYWSLFPSQGFLLQGFMNHINLKNFYLLLRFREDSNKLREWLYQKAAKFYLDTFNDFFLHADRSEEMKKLWRLYAQSETIPAVVKEPTPDWYLFSLPQDMQDYFAKLYKRRVEHDPITFFLQCLNQGEYGRILATVAIGPEKRLLGNFWFDKEPTIKKVAREILAIFPSVSCDVIKKLPFLSDKDQPQLIRGQDQDFVLDALYFGCQVPRPFG